MIAQTKTYKNPYTEINTLMLMVWVTYFYMQVPYGTLTMGMIFFSIIEFQFSSRGWVFMYILFMMCVYLIISCIMWLKNLWFDSDTTNLLVMFYNCCYIQNYYWFCYNVMYSRLREHGILHLLLCCNHMLQCFHGKFVDTATLNLWISE